MAQTCTPPSVKVIDAKWKSDGTDLAGAKLTGAYVGGAKFYDVRLAGATLTELHGTAHGLPPGVPAGAAQTPNTGRCLADGNYWDTPKPSKP